MRASRGVARFASSRTSLAWNACSALLAPCFDQAHARQLFGLARSRSPRSRSPGASTCIAAPWSPPSLIPLLCSSPHPQAAFVGEEVSNILKESIDGVLANVSYNHNMVRPKKEPPPALGSTPAPRAGPGQKLFCVRGSVTLFRCIRVRPLFFLQPPFLFFFLAPAL